MNPHKAPRWVRLLARLLRADHRDEIVADLIEERALLIERGRSRGYTLFWLAAHLVRSVAAGQRGARAVLATNEAAPTLHLNCWLGGLWQDAAYAVTSFRRQPVFSVGVILTLGLGLGLVTFVFTFANATFYQPWRVPDPDSLLFIRPNAAPGNDFAGMSVPEYRFLREQSKTILHMSLTVRGGRSRLQFGDGSFESVGSMEVTANYFEALGIPLIAGRPFLRDEDTAATPARVAIISERLWDERFQRDHAITGKSILLDGSLYTIVGVAPASLLDGHGSKTEIWRALGLAEYADPRHRDFPHATLGRLARGSTPAQAQAELASLSAGFRSGFQLPATSFRLVDTRPSSTGLGGERQIVELVFFALLVVQLVACANVGNLLVARAIARQGEIAVRMSLGAGRWRVVRQLLTEVLVLALAAGALGLAVSIPVPPIVIGLVPDWGERAALYAPTAATFALAFGLSLLTAVACGLTPALRATRVSLSSLAGERHGQTASSARLRRTLLVAQVALATVLLTGAALLTRAIGRAAGTDPGFAIGEFQEVTVKFPGGTQGPRRKAFYERLSQLTRTGDWPPIALSEQAPIEDDHYGLPARVQITDPIYFLASRGVSSNYFETLGIRLLAGRAPADTDGRELVLNESLAKRFWPGESPIGKTLISGMRSDNLKTHVVVGIAPDLALRSLGTIEPVAYRASQLFFDRVLVRSRDSKVVERLREAASGIDPEVTISARPLKEIVVDALYAALIGSRVAWAIGGIGLILTTIGAFGVFAHAVEERRREIGIRMALGAQAAQVVRAVMATTQRSVLTGVCAGVMLAAIAAPLLRSYLYGLSPFDPAAYLQIAALLAVSALVATWIPARRVARINPAQTLRG